MRRHISFCNGCKASSWAFHQKLLAISFEVNNYLFVSQECLVFIAVYMGTALESNLHHDIFEFQVGGPKVRFLVARGTSPLKVHLNAFLAVEGITVLATDRIIHEHHTDGTAPLLLVLLVCELHQSHVVVHILVWNFNVLNLLWMFLFFYHPWLILL